MIIVTYPGFDSFPNVFETFPSVEYLLIAEGAVVRYVDDSLVPVHSALKNFICFCKLVSIPGAINLFSHLEQCDLRNNRIETVERHSFDGLRHLWFINLSNNPIIYISKFAFRNLDKLSSLYLGRTMLKTIPQAVQNIPNLNHLYQTNVTCSCGEPWMKEWADVMSRKLSPYKVEGACRNSNETLSDFVFNRLQTCS